MKRKLLAVLWSVVPVCGVMVAFPAVAQTPYFQAVTNSSPAGYWPMHEVAAPVPGDIETNLGSLGSLANGYYADWIPMTPLTTHGVAGALAGDSDTGAAFNGAKNGGGQGFLLVPKTSPAMTIKPPFSIEAWAYPSNTAYADMVSQFGYAQNGANTGARYGFRLIWDGKFHLEFGTATGSSGVIGITHTALQWYHVVVTCDGVNGTVWVNGAVEATGPVTPNWDPALPLTIGNGFWAGSGPQRAYNGAIDEVAVYDHVLPDANIQAHYNTGINATPPTPYKNTVLADAPLVYLRMDGPAYTAPALSTWPVLNNYGSVALNGAYSPGSMPGAVTGPSLAGVPFAGMGASAVMPGNGMSSYATAGYDPAFNPTATPFSFGAWFKGNPADSRSFQTVMGHSDRSWRAAINKSGQLQAHGAGGPDLTSSTAYNDGNWHQFIVTAIPSNSAALTPGTNMLYVDGLLVVSNISASLDVGTNADLIIGNDPQYLNGTTMGRSYAGQVCEAAFWSRTLTSVEVKALWNTAGVPPTIKTQPVTASVNQGSTFTNTVGVIGSDPVAYQWYQNGQAKSGQTTASLGLNPVQSSDAGSYYVVATSPYGTATSVVCQLTVVVRPAILAQLPVTYTNIYTLYAGSSPTFALTSVSGAAPLSYLWYTNGVADVSGTNATYQLHNVQVGWITNYCVVTNLAGSASSYVWTAAVLPAPAQPYPQSVLGLKPIGYWRLNEADNGLANGNPGAVAHDYLGGNNGVFTNATLGDVGYSLGLANQYLNPGLATDPLTTSPVLGTLATTNCDAFGIYGIDFSAPTNTSVAFSVSAWVKGTGQATGNTGIASKGYFYGEQFSLDTGASGKCYRFEVRDAKGNAYNANSTVAAKDSLWHHLVGVCDEFNGVVSLYIDGTNAATVSIPVGGGITASNAAVPMIIGARPTSATSSADNQFYGNINDVALYNYALSAGQVASNFIAAGVAPQITQQPPATATVAEGGTLTLSAAAFGTSPLSLQWQALNNPTLVVNQTNATLVISNVPASLNYDNLFLRATNIYGSVDSVYASVTVVSGPPQIAASSLPARVSLPLGKSYTYSVVAGGSMPFTYQWSTNGVVVSGETKSSFTVTGSALGTSTISVTVNNTYGSASGSSVLTVIPMIRDSYATNVLALQPAGYWPLQETNAPAAVTTEINYGTLGALGNAYYAATNPTTVTFGQGGALGGSGDSDTAVSFDGTVTSYAFVPRVTPALTLRPPLSLECWLNSASTGFSDLMGESGSGLNATGGNGNWGGVRLCYGGNATGGPALQFYIADGNGTTRNQVMTGPNTLPLNQWHHCVATYDGTTATLYIDGQVQTNGPLAMAIDTWTPFTIGGSMFYNGVPQRRYTGMEDEVAVYTNLLTAAQVAAHYSAGTSFGSGYRQTVLNDKPLLYYRMDALSYVTPNPGAAPNAVNYGFAQANGFYAGGVVPGGVPGPAIVGLSSNLAAPINGLISCVDAGSDSAFNPTNRQPLSVLTWFRAYPSDGRVQALMSHGTGNWALNLDGTTGHVVWNLYSGGQVTSSGILNDGNWHMVAGVSDGTTSSLYVDGALDVSGVVATAGLASEPFADLILGGNSAFTGVGTGTQMYFAGALSQAAYFTNALSAAQIQHLYSVATTVAVPTISMQQVGGNLVITYTGTLWSSTNVSAYYAPVSGATPPSYTVPLTDAQRFYRSSNP